MELLLLVSCLSLFGLAVTILAFGAATRSEPTESTQPETQPVLEVAPARFFADAAVPPQVLQPRVPIEALLLQIENHVRLEQAAAESFLESPTSALLHSRTISPLIQ